MNWGCAGRTPQPIMIEQSQDSSLTCSQLGKTLEQIMVQINGLYSEGKSRRKNTRLFGYLSYIFPPATLLKDFKKADKVEIAALNKRHNHLVKIAREKGCRTNKQLIPDKQHCKDFFTLDCVLPTTERNESKLNLIIGPINNDEANKLVSTFIMKGYKQTEIIIK